MTQFDNVKKDNSDSEHSSFSNSKIIETSIDKSNNLSTKKSSTKNEKIYNNTIGWIKSAKEISKEHRGVIIEGTVIQIIDGDTFKLLHAPRMHPRKYIKGDPLLSIRLAGIDTPELSHFGKPAQKFSDDAKNLLKSLIENKTVSVKILALDSFKRIIGVVSYVNEEGKIINVSLEMLKCGMARIYMGKKADYGDGEDEFESKLFSALKFAAKNRIGIWSDTAFYNEHII